MQTPKILVNEADEPLFLELAELRREEDRLGRLLRRLADQPQLMQRAILLAVQSLDAKAVALETRLNCA
jgi:hypothetical protein